MVPCWKAFRAKAVTNILVMLAMWRTYVANGYKAVGEKDKLNSSKQDAVADRCRETSFNVTILGSTRNTFSTFDNAVKYIRLFANSEQTVFGPRECFERIHRIIVEDVYDEWGKEKAVYERWMINLPGNFDYFEFKDMRTASRAKYDFKATWLKYGGESASIE